MKRFMGMMPSDEIEIAKTYTAKSMISSGEGVKITVQAGPNGWTILWPDNSSQYNDEVDSSENNFEKALSHVKAMYKDDIKY